jgi:hypothetical protein
MSTPSRNVLTFSYAFRSDARPEQFLLNAHDHSTHLQRIHVPVNLVERESVIRYLVQNLAPSFPLSDVSSYRIEPTVHDARPGFKILVPNQQTLLDLAQSNGRAFATAGQKPTTDMLPTYILVVVLMAIVLVLGIVGLYVRRQNRAVTRPPVAPLVVKPLTVKDVLLKTNKTTNSVYYGPGIVEYVQ